MSSEIGNNNKRLAKNTVLLYFRMFITMGVGLYTSRILLNALGVENYGINNVVGGVVAMLSFLSGSLTGATTRFLTFEIGRNNAEKLKETFSAILLIHVGLAVVMVLLLEGVGSWFVIHKLTLPPERMDAALFVFHLSVMACMIEILKLPYTGVIIAHEKMDVFAYVSILDVCMKLLIAYLIIYTPFDKLKTYSSLFFIANVISTSLYVLYAHRHFIECKFRITFNKYIIRPILAFSGWDLFGNLSVVVRTQGINILLNTFFGAVINAATGIANTVLSVVMGFSDNFLTAVRPQIVKYYATEDYKSFNALVINASKFCTGLLLLVSLPIVTEAHYILNLWLVDVPEYAVQFCQLTIVNNWVSMLFRPIVFGIYATGNARRISIINGSIYILVLPVSYLFLKNGGSPIIPFVWNIILLAVGHLCFSLTTLKRYVPTFTIRHFLYSSFLKCSLVVGASLLISYAIRQSMTEGMGRLLVNSVVLIVVVCLMFYYICLNKDNRIQCAHLMRAKLGKLRRSTSPL
jgi:O-antigen/teichoic acid export membrane protein